LREYNFELRANHPAVPALPGVPRLRRAQEQRATHFESEVQEGDDLLLVVVELSFQAFYRLTTGAFLLSRAAVPMFVDDPGGGWTPKPNLAIRQRTPEFDIDVFTNSRGFRTSRAHEEYAPGPDASRYRIMLLGPSFAFGWGVNYEQTFAAQLKATLAEKGFSDGRQLELINRGVPALPPEYSLNWFKRVGKTYAPDLVILFLYGSMEFNPAVPMRVKDGYLEVLNPTLSERATVLAKRSAIVFYGWTVLTNVRGAMSHGKGGDSIEGAGREMKVVEAFEQGEVAIESGSNPDKSLQVFRKTEPSKANTRLQE
jgi:hypothetical protein